MMHASRGSYLPLAYGVVPSRRPHVVLYLCVAAASLGRRKVGVAEGVGKEAEDACLV